MKYISISIYLLLFSQVVFSETTLNKKDNHFESTYKVINYFLNTVDESIGKIPKASFNINSPDNGLESKSTSTSVKILKEDMEENKIIKIEFNIVVEMPVLSSLLIINYNVDSNRIESIESYDEGVNLKDNSIVHYFRVFQNQSGWRITSTDYGSTNLVIISDENGNYIFENE